MSAKATAKKRRMHKRSKLAKQRVEAERMKLYGVKHLGFAIYGKEYDPEKHGTPY